MKKTITIAVHLDIADDDDMGTIMQEICDAAPAIHDFVFDADWPDYQKYKGEEEK